MEFYASPDDEIAAIRRAAKRAGCKVRAIRRDGARVDVIDGLSRIVSDGPEQTVGDIACRDGWGAARLLLALAIEDSRTPGARALARSLRGSSDDETFARTVHAYVGQIPFVRERGELFQSGALTINRNAGDCDDHFRLAFALGVAGGLRSALGVLHHGDRVAAHKRGPAHAVAVFYVDGGWTYAETTVAAAFGESPTDATRRLGLTNERSDIAREVRIMTEQDLPDAPDGFRERNSAAQVAADAEALQQLGYLDADAPASQMCDPTFSVLRRAVLAFQKKHGLSPDGLLGPVTRAEIGRALTAAGRPTMGDFDTVAIRHTSDLTDEFLSLVVAMADRFRVQGAHATAEDWLAVWLAESGIRNIPNHAGEPFAGLNQMGVKERQECGFTGTTAEWLALSLEQQLPFVDCYYQSAARMGGGAHVFRDAGSLYVANFAPAHLPHAGEPNHALYSYRAIPGMPSLHASEAEWAAYNKNHSDPYAENRQLDRQRKGFISVDDMRVAVEGPAAGSARYLEARDRVRALGGRPSAPSGSVARGLVASLLFVGAGGALAYAYSQGWV